MKRFFPVLAAAILVMSCGDEQPAPTFPLSGTPQVSILDGAHPPAEGEPWVPEFYWFPEIVESPTIVGTFNPDVPARVRICELDGLEPSLPTTEECQGADATLFGPDDITVSMTPPGQYQVGWKTDAPTPIGLLDPDKYYRLSVWVGTGENAVKLGHRDFDPEPSPPAGSNPKVEPYYPFKLGNTIAIKFWIGEGAFCESADPSLCGECFYTENGAQDGNSDTVGRACTAGDRAGVYIPPTPDIDGYLIVVERIPNDPDGYTVADGRTLTCYRDPDEGNTVDFIQGLDIPQWGECFVVTATCTLDSCTDLTNVDLNAIVGSCPLVPDNPDYHAVIHRTDNALSPSFTQALDPADTFIPGEGDFLDCSVPLSPVQSALSKLWRTFTPFDPEPAYASHRSLKGADAPSFSDFVWATSSQQEKSVGDDQTGLVGTTLPDLLTVNVSDRVPSTFWDDDGSRANESEAVQWADVTFTLRDGSGGVWTSGGIGTGFDGSGACENVQTSQIVTTDANGDAEVCVVLPSDAGSYYIDAGGYGIGEKDQAWAQAVGTGVGPYSHFALCETFAAPSTCAPYSIGDLIANDFDPILLPPGDVSGLVEPDPRSDLVTFTATACNPGAGSATVDGVLTPGEWDCATFESFTAQLSGGAWPATVYWMVDRTGPTDLLYMALKVDRSDDARANILTIYLDDEGDGLSENDDVLNLDGQLPIGSQFTDQHVITQCIKGQSFCGELDDSQQGSGVFQINNDNGSTYYFYEIVKPLVNDVNGQDADTSIGLRYFIALRYGNGAQGGTYHPDYNSWIDPN